MTIRWILDLALVGATLVVIALSFAAIGAVVRRALGGQLQSLDDAFLAFWVGFAAVTWSLIVWNFAFPIDAATLFVVMAVAAVCCALSAGPVLRAVGERWARPQTGGAIILIFAAIWVASQCLAPYRSWDGVLYHIQGVAWAKAYPAIPGIANLHGPLAFNNSSFLYDALVDSWIWNGRGFHIANGALFLVAVVQGLSAGLRWRRQGMRDHSRLFEFLLLPIALYYTPDVATYSTDLPMALTLSAAIARTWAVLDDSRHGARPVSREAAVALAMLFGAAIAIKLTAAVFAAAALAVVAWRARQSAWAWVAVTLLIFLGPWVARGIVLSGYPFFPIPYLGLEVDWRAPLEHARAELAYIAFTEREFSWRVVNKGWLYLTFVRNVAAILLPAVVSVLAYVLWWRLRGTARLPGRGTGNWWIAMPSLAGIVAWLASAPSHRYAPVLFWTLAAVSVCHWLIAALRTSRMKANTAWIVALTIGVSPLMASVGSTFLVDGTSAGIQSLRRNFMGLQEAGLSSLPTDFPVQTFVTRSGLELNTPKTSPNMPGRPNACGSIPTPCTANPAANLELREPARLERGFRVRGEWSMANWPYHWRAAFLAEWRSREQDGDSRR